MNEILEALKIHGPVAAILMIFAIVGARHGKKDEGLAERVRALETNRVVKEDLTRVHSRLDDLSSQVAEGQREILLAIQKK